MDVFNSDELITFARTLQDQTLLTCTGLPFSVSVQKDRIRYLRHKEGASQQIQSKAALDRTIHHYLETRSVNTHDYQMLTRTASYSLPLIEAFFKNGRVRAD